MRSAWFVVGLALRRLRRRDSGALVTALGLAVATAVLAGVLAGTTIATDRSTAQAIEGIPTSARSVRAAWFGIPGNASERLNVLDGAVDEASQGLGLDGPSRLVLFRESTVAGHYVGITAAVDLAQHVVLPLRRMPRTCTAAHCEVLRLRRAQDDAGRSRAAARPGRNHRRSRSRRFYDDFIR